MTAELIFSGAERLTLPALLDYRLVHTDGSSADSFSLRFPAQPELLHTLRRTADLRLQIDGVTRFRGIIDEIEASYGETSSVTLCGRGLAARLMDNQVIGAEYYSADLGMILERYVKPFGITDIQVQGGPWRMQMFRVGAGNSCFQVLHGFCLHANAPQPRFLPNGTLCIAPSSTVHSIKTEQLLSAAWRFCRYGVISEQLVLDLTSGLTRAATAPELLSLGVRSRQVATRSGPLTHLTERTAQQRILRVRAGLDTLILTLPGQHPAQPCDTVRLQLPELSVEANYLVTETVLEFDGSREITQLSLRAKEQ